MEKDLVTYCLGYVTLVEHAGVCENSYIRLDESRQVTVYYLLSKLQLKDLADARPQFPVYASVA